MLYPSAGAGRVRRAGVRVWQFSYTKWTHEAKVGPTVSVPAWAGDDGFKMTKWIRQEPARRTVVNE